MAQLFAILMLSRKSCHSITTLLKSPSRVSIEAWYPWQIYNPCLMTIMIFILSLWLRLVK